MLLCAAFASSASRELIVDGDMCLSLGCKSQHVACTEMHIVRGEGLVADVVTLTIRVGRTVHILLGKCVIVVW